MAESTPTCVKAVVENLAAYLKDNMPSLTKVIQGFPAANIQLAYPVMSISPGNPVFTSLDPELLSQGDTDENNRAVVKRIVGMYDLQLQLDLWCRDKVERFNLWEEFFVAFNPDITPMNLRLKMTDYHDIWCGYHLTGYNLDESEASSQRGEWRARIGILANTRAVLSRSEYVIGTIENEFSLPPTGA